MVSGRCFYLDRFILTILLTAWPAAGVLQPTRASIMTGRTHQRDCINFALSCDQEDPASTCAAGNEGALPTTEFTFANAAKVLQTRHHSGPFLTRFSARCHHFGPPRRRSMHSTWLSRVSDADWSLRSNVMPNSAGLAPRQL